MATRSTIAVEIEDGYIVQVYAHWDGYLEHNGKILFKHYNTLAKAAMLVAGGDISSLAPTLFPEDGRESTHTFDNPIDGITVYYTRDRGEKAHPHVFTSHDDMYKHGLAEEYNYVFKDGEWFVSSDETGKNANLLRSLANKGIEL
jgi:hypothetical protein